MLRSVIDDSDHLRRVYPLHLTPIDSFWDDSGDLVVAAGKVFFSLTGHLINSSISIALESICSVSVTVELLRQTDRIRAGTLTGRAGNIGKYLCPICVPGLHDDRFPV